MDQCGTFIREITSLQHPIVKHFCKLRQNRDYRKQENSTVVSGKKLVEELAAGFKFKNLFINKNFPLHSNNQAQNIFSASPAVFKKLTGLENPEPFAAEISLPHPSDLSNKKLILALDGISDPGNLGTLLRTALALNWEGVFIGQNCTDPFGEKAVRAALGASFRLPITYGSPQDLEQLIAENKMQVLIADAKGIPLDQSLVQPPLLLILGNESHGVDPYYKNRFPLISIPISKKVESLNAAIAGGILMHAIQSRLHR